MPLCLMRLLHTWGAGDSEGDESSKYAPDVFLELEDVQQRARMRITTLFSLACAATSALAWDNFDHEIFDLVSALEAAEGKATSFYSFLNVTPAATTAEVSRQYRKRSLELHPDKNPDRKDAEERFARLGTIANILRDSEKRERYHHFYVNGVPKWRGTGYYYSRYRPGLGSVLIALASFTCILQYLVQVLNYHTARQRIVALRQRAINVAYGLHSTPKQREIRKTRLRVPRTEIDGDSRAFLMTVQGSTVWLVDEVTKEEHLLDDAEVPRPRLGRTWAPSLVRSSLSRFIKTSPTPQKAIEADGQIVEDAATESDAVASASDGGASTPTGTSSATAGKAAKKRKQGRR